ncbi:LysR family transcriptional regulator [Alisedimentitalea sp. MJ-SS2]|uniref:LysR family transcriptional regulator n=1 Tax=Aliisedimentitalea sp. MJ-SS2 TaxID=3049795 RepID=UPI002910111F|nr:LysR family transcriptional regulator [Alisedimentitalea sp. MJ-SS2]MDU8929590.1 LysR family transcriptional regulator [Alisedimentitalea sp. MJ-SS2]
MTQLDLNLFVVFDRIYTERNLTRAAESLSLTQPTVSNALARLRKALDDPLFVKTQTGMRPTAYAESIRDSVGEALRLLTISAQATSRFDATRSKRVFRLSVIDLLDVTVFAFLGTQGRVVPNLSFRSFRVERKNILPALSAGAIDIAVDIALPEASGLVRVPYSVDSFVCAMRPDHPLAQVSLTLDDYLNFAHIHVSGRRDGGAAIDAVLRREGRRRAIALRLQNYVSAVSLLHATDYLMTVPSKWAMTQQLVCKTLPVVVPPLETFLYRHRRTDGDQAVLWLFDRIESGLT